MKTIYAAFILIAVIFVFCLCFDIMVKSDVDSITAKIERMNRLTRASDYLEAGAVFSEIENEWRKKEKYLQIMTEHGELDAINEQLAAIRASYRNNEYDSIFQHIYTLDYFINHIYEKKIVNISTIL